VGAHLLQQLVVLFTGGAGLAEVGGAVDDRLLLVFVEDARDDRLGCDAVALVVDDNCAECVQAVDVKDIEGANALEVVDGRGVGGVVASEVEVVVFDVEAKTEEHVIPDEHLNPRLGFFRKEKYRV